jgi:putative endonuclease
MTWYMYVVLCFDNSLYCGITTNLERRLKQHNGVIKGGAKYTRGRRPCKYVHKEKALNRSDALKKEYRFKKLSKKNKLSYIDYFLSSGSM